MAEQERCETCRFFRKSPNELEYDSGFCHRNSPRLIEGMMVRDEFDELKCSMFSWAVFPRIIYDDWCGEYQPQEEQ